MSTKYTNPHGPINAVLSDPSASYWLKNALQSALKRDIVDAANDAATLAALLAAIEACEVQS